MDNFIVYPKTKAQISILKALFKEMKIPYRESINPSPSKDKYFDDPGNIRELDRRIAKQAIRKPVRKVVIKSKEELKNFLEL